MLENLSSNVWACILGYNLGKKGVDAPFTWLYTKRPELDNLSPKDYLDINGDGKKVADVFRKDFQTELEMPDFKEN